MSSNWCYRGWARSVSGGSGDWVKGWGGEGGRTGLESLERGEISFQGLGGGEDCKERLLVCIGGRVDGSVGVPEER